MIATTFDELLYKVAPFITKLNKYFDEGCNIRRNKKNYFTIFSIHRQLLFDEIFLNSAIHAQIDSP
nr:unnamed protein product [Callosobruchus chinensis]